MADPDLVFDTTKAPELAELRPIYDAVLGSGPAPRISLGAVTRAVAEAWLDQQQERYRAALGRRSSALIQKIDLKHRVELVGLIQP